MSMVWYGMAWHGTARHGTVRYDAARCGTIRYCPPLLTFFLLAIEGVGGTFGLLAS